MHMVVCATLNVNILLVSECHVKLILQFKFLKVIDIFQIYVTYINEHISPYFFENKTAHVCCFALKSEALLLTYM